MWYLISVSQSISKDLISFQILESVTENTNIIFQSSFLDKVRQGEVINVKEKDGKLYYIGVEDIEICEETINRFTDMVSIIGYRTDIGEEVVYKVTKGGDMNYSFTKEDIIKLIEDGTILNTKIENGEIILAEYVKDLSNSDGYEDSIKEKIKQFKSKAQLLGCHSDFDIEVEADKVKIIKFHGRGGKTIIIPDFVDSIRYDAFFGIVQDVRNIPDIVMDLDKVYIKQVIFPGDWYSKNIDRLKDYI